MKKRAEAFVLAVVMLLTLVVPAFAQSITLALDKDTVKAGEDVTVTVSFDEDLEHVSGLALNLHFNSDLFTYKEGQEFDDYAVIVRGEEGTAPDLYKVINWASLKGVGTIKAGKYVTCTFTAKEDIRDVSNAEFVAKVDMYNTTMAPGYDDPTYPDSKISVTVTPASSVYTVSASAVNSAIVTGEDAQVAVKIENTVTTTYNAYYLEVSYDSSILTYKSINTDAAVTDSNGTLKIAGYGSDKTCGTDNIVLTFTGKAVGEAKVTLTSAKVDAKANAAENDAPDAAIKADAADAAITVGGYPVTLPDDFTGAGTALPGQDYTFTARDSSRKYDFTGSTMGGQPVEVVDNGDGTYTVKNVTGALVIQAAAQAQQVTIEETGNGWEDVMNRTGWTKSGDTVEEGTSNLEFMIQPKNDRTYVVTANGTVLTGVPMQGGMMVRYAVPAELVKGEKLTINITYTEPSADSITIIETGDAWGDVTQRSTWPAGGGQITPAAGDTYLLKIKLAAGKTVDDYVVTINGKEMTLKRQGPTYSVSFNPTEVAVDGVITIDVSYKKAPQPELTVSVSEYVKLDGKSIFLVTASGDVADGSVLAYGDAQMYWSAKYNGGQGAYAWLVISDKTLDEVKTEAQAQITVVTGTRVDIAYSGDVNLTDRVDINDAQLVWNMYNAEYTDFQTVNVRKFLEADMTADGKLDTADAAAITALLTK